MSDRKLTPTPQQRKRTDASKAFVSQEAMAEFDRCNWENKKIHFLQPLW
jgi:hypothetical protein